MTIYQIVQIRDSTLINVIAAYTDLEEATKELEWRNRTAGPSIYEQSLSPRDPYDIRLSSNPYAHSTRDTYKVMATELITDKFTEFALTVKQKDQHDTN